jgi:hypothetical protein
VAMTGRTLRIVALAGLAGLAGCQGGPVSSHQAMVGSLKTSVSQLEYQNDELARQVAGLKAENRRFEDRLVQERAENERLSAQLGDSPGDVRTGARSRSGSTDDPDNPPSSRVRQSRSRRAPPAVAIPGQIEPAKPAPGDDDLSSLPSTPRGRLASRRSVDDRWLPVARGIGSGDGTVK